MHVFKLCLIHRQWSITYPYQHRVTLLFTCSPTQRNVSFYLTFLHSWVPFPFYYFITFILKNKLLQIQLILDGRRLQREDGRIQAEHIQIGLGEIAQWLRAVAVLPEDPSSALSTQVQWLALPVTLAPRYPMPSSGLHEHCTCVHIPPIEM